MICINNFTWIVVIWHIDSDHHKAGGTLLEVGCGPSLHLAFTASKVYQDITLSDYTDSNRQQISKWLNKEQDAHDWSPYINYISSLEQNK